MTITRAQTSPRIGLIGAIEAIAAALLFAAAWIEVVADPAPPLPVALAIVGAAAVTLPIALARAVPEAAAASVFAAVALQGLAVREPSSIAEEIALAIAIGQAAVRVRRFRLPLLLLGALAAGLLVFRSADDVQVSDFVFTGGVLVVPFAVGLLIRGRIRAATAARERTRQALARRRELAQLAVQEERARVARELHDVVAHALSVVVVQAVGGRTVLDRDPGAAAGAFDTIESMGARALQEMRHLLGALHAVDAGAEPAPGLDAIPELARVATTAGLPTSVRVTGRARALAPSIELSAYRITQEALTNAVRHAHGGSAAVEVLHGPDLRLTIRNRAGVSAGADLLPGGGNGIVGMRERAALCGGTLRASPTPDGGFVVEAVLPTRSR